MAAPRTALLFPGQGSQEVGMGSDWASAFDASRRLWELADESLGFPLSRLCRQGPEEELQLTANTQPAILATSLAMLAAIDVGRLAPVAVAGHSLGEYTALVAAGSLDAAEALRLVRRRGELMQEAVPVGEGAMAAILGLDGDAVAEVAAEAAGDEVCAVANRNAPSQTVIAGHASAVGRAVELAKGRGARRAVVLPVSAPFHCPLMEPARRGLAPLLAAADFRDPSPPVVTNVDAAPARTAAAVRDALERQVDGEVRWVESVRRMADGMGVELFVEVGPGSVLSGLVRRIAPAAATLSISRPADLEKLPAAAPADYGTRH